MSRVELDQVSWAVVGMGEIGVRQVGVDCEGCIYRGHS